MTFCVEVATENGKIHPNNKYFKINPEVEIEKPENHDRVFDDQIYLGASFLFRTATDRVGLSKALEENLSRYGELILTFAEYYMMERNPRHNYTNITCMTITQSIITLQILIKEVPEKYTIEKTQ